MIFMPRLQNDTAEIPELERAAAMSDHHSCATILTPIVFMDQSETRANLVKTALNSSRLNKCHKMPHQPMCSK